MQLHIDNRANVRLVRPHHVTDGLRLLEPVRWKMLAIAIAVPSFSPYRPTVP